MNEIDAAGSAPMRTLDARYYTDPAVYENEKAGLLSRTWQFAGHVAALQNSGDYFSFEVAGENLFCIRGKDDTVRTFYNVCQHRAHELVSGEGSCKAIVCPYHAWTYDFEGALRAGPNIKAVPGLNREEIYLTEVRTEIFCGFIFVNLNPETKPMAEWFPGVEKDLRAFVPQIDDLAPLEWVDVQEKCNWKISVENYSECYHCAINHPTFVSGVVNPNTWRNRAEWQLSLSCE